MNSGIRGVKWNSKNQNWNVAVTVDGVRKYLGSFKTVEEAKECLIKNNIPINSNVGGSKHNVDTLYFDVIDTPEKAFWLGFICADGSIKSNRKSLCFKITQKDGELLEQLKKDISFTGEVNQITKSQKGRFSDKPFYEIVVYSTDFCNTLLQAGKTRLKKDLDKIPESVPENLKIDFIRGYFEGDGALYYHNSTKSWGFAFSGYKGLLSDIKEYLNIGVIYTDRSIYKLSSVGNTITSGFVEALYYKDSVYGTKHLEHRGFYHGL